MAGWTDRAQPCSGKNLVGINTLTKNVLVLLSLQPH
jgi:hypothetical protein